MAGRTYLFDEPDGLVAGALGEPGHRTFFLQATKGRAVVTVALEKVQVALLAERIGAFARHSGDALPAQPELREPVVEAFRVGSITLTYDEEGQQVTLEAQEVGAPGHVDGDGPDADQVAGTPDDDDDLDILRVRLTLADAVSFAEGALRVVAAGRPPCPLCGEPLDPQGHICLRRNGYVM